MMRCVLIAVGLLAATAPATALGQRGQETPQDRASVRGRVLLQLLMTRGQAASYMGEQTTRLLDGAIPESRQIVKHAGPGRDRIEFLTPPRVQGDVILDIRGRRFHLRMRPVPRVVSSEVPPDMNIGQARALVAAVRAGKVTVRHVGFDRIAGRIADIVEIKPLADAPYKRIWVDRASGVRLKHETVDSSGSVIASSFFTKIEMNPSLDASDFDPASLTARAPGALPANAESVATLAEAQARVSFRIREPSMPPPYRLTRIWLVGAGRDRGVTTTYSDGVNTLTLSQRRQTTVAVKGGQKPLIRPGAARWVADGVVYTLVGPVRRPVLERILRSLQ
jgi:hypothetical protein